MQLYSFGKEILNAGVNTKSVQVVDSQRKRQFLTRALPWSEEHEEAGGDFVAPVGVSKVRPRGISSTEKQLLLFCLIVCLDVSPMYSLFLSF